MMTFRAIVWRSLLLAGIGSVAHAADDSIDSILDRVFVARNIQPAERCSDDVFLRRVTLDLAGRIPRLEEVLAFQARPDRQARIDTLLASDEFSTSWSELWTSMLVGHRDDLAGDRELLRSWLDHALQARLPYDTLASRLIGATGQSALDGQVCFLLRAGDEPAIRVSRLFLGVRLDCARCHDHPFDRWKNEDFQQVSRFFSAMRNRQIAPGNVELYDDTRQTSGVGPDERPRFLTGARPRTAMWRKELALFITHSKPFARTYANRLWYQLLGRGIVDPPDDFHRQNAPSSPELLEFLASLAREQGFDVRAMVRTICNSQAYQRSTATAGRSPEELAVFAARTIKPMSAEQSIDSVAIALDRGLGVQERSEFVRNTIGSAADDDFSSTWKYRESVQGLLLRLTRRATAPAGTLDELFLRTLTRLPTAAERELCANQSRDDIAFALVNGSEFFFNH